MSIYLGALLAVLFVWHFFFIYSVRKKRNDIADLLWGPSFLVAVAGGLWTEHLMGRSVALGSVEIGILFCLFIWAARLAYHIGQRFLSKDKEDVRYNKWRQEWGNTWLWRSYLQVFILQPVILLAIVAMILQAMTVAPREITWWVIFGFLIFVTGFVLESVADEQLRRFIANKNNRGKVMDQGLWSWSRHPNYFGEVTQWWGLYFMCFSSLENWWTILSPIAITFLILKVSGVSMLEELMMKRPGFAEYAQRTSIFIPLPPKR